MTLHDSIGATAVVAFLYGGDAIIGHVGDCRAYTLRQGNLRQLTRDQTVIEELIQAGKLTEQQAKDHPAVGEVSQAIGCEPTIEPAFYHVTIAPGDWLILASDGLQADLDLKDIETAVKRTNLSPGGLANHLVELANKSGGSDNCTVVVVRAYAPNSDRASQR
ncbi:MAG: hypothetical protein KatS3mg105_2389 [Gemmatales bacterium]|nr:MAG: hypothetical protein KatS3mg105_2389 [Gemmatales bacterium]